MAFWRKKEEPIIEASEPSLNMDSMAELAKAINMSTESMNKASQTMNQAAKDLTKALNNATREFKRSK